MRTLEIIAICILAVTGLLLLRKGRSNWLSRVVLAVAVFVLVLHLVLEGPHWQMAPAYTSALMLGWALVLRNVLWKRVLASVSLLLLIAAVGLCQVLPMFHLPAPDGPYPIGTAIFQLTDASRTEDAVKDGSKREVVVQAWYPAACDQHRFDLYRLAPYRRWKETTLVSSYQRFVWTHSCKEGKLASANAPFPVLLFNPAMNGRRTQSTFLLEELASQGFVVFAIDHPYNSDPVELASGKVVGPPSSGIWENLGTLGAAHAYKLLDEEVRKQAADTRFVLDVVQAWNADPSSPFYRKLDMDRVGALGHSLGGAVAVETALQDSRIRAVFDMSGPLYASARQQDLKAPFFYMTEHIPFFSQAELARMDADTRLGVEMDMQDMTAVLSALARDGGYYAELPTDSHASFTDKPLFSPIARLGGGDPATVNRLHSMIRQYAVAFFTQTLRSSDSPLLRQVPSPFTGVIFRWYKPFQPPAQTGGLQFNPMVRNGTVNTAQLLINSSRDTSAGK